MGTSQRELIAERLGRRGNPATQLSKPTLNSLHAWITGTYLVEPADVYADEAPSLQSAKRGVADLCNLKTYIEYVDEVSGRDRPFNHSELSSILRILSELEDSRPGPTAQRHRRIAEW